MINKIGSLTTVNGGTIRDWPTFSAEILGPGYSIHNKNMVVLYASEGNIKVSIVYDGKNFYIYRFRNHESLQHYWSRKCDIEWTLYSDKYNDISKKCIIAYNDVFGNK